MASVSHGPAAYTGDRAHWTELLRSPDLWGSLAISMMWLAVLFAAVFGPDFVSTSGAGTSSTTVPSAVFVAFFAFLGSASVAKYAFGRDRR